jgi:hypothetical protein
MVRVRGWRKDAIERLDCDLPGWRPLLCDLTIPPPAALHNGSRLNLVVAAAGGRRFRLNPPRENASRRCPQREEKLALFFPNKTAKTFKTFKTFKHFCGSLVASANTLCACVPDYGRHNNADRATMNMITGWVRA